MKIEGMKFRNLPEAAEWIKEQNFLDIDLEPPGSIIEISIESWWDRLKRFFS